MGHNTDGKYFVNANKLTFHFETSPKKVVLYIEKSKEGHVTPVDGVQIVDFACGNNHTVSIALFLCLKLCFPPKYLESHLIQETDIPVIVN